MKKTWVSSPSNRYRAASKRKCSRSVPKKMVTRLNAVLIHFAKCNVSYEVQLHRWKNKKRQLAWKK